jgi:short-subunit dehydrogenase
MSVIESILFPNKKLNFNKLNQKIKGKTIVITGASFGIGEELSLLLSHHQVHLVLIARTTEKLEILSGKIVKNGSQCTIVTANLYNEIEVDKTIDILKNLQNGIDIFISNAGKSIMRSLLDSLDRYTDFTRTNSLNYLAPVKLLLALTPILKKNKGHIINVSAINVLLLPAPKWSAYQASKTAFDQWFRANTSEWKEMGIQAKTMYLPLVRTRMIAPNKTYDNYPAMHPEQVAIKMTHLICSSSSYFQPWWTPFLKFASFLGRDVWELILCFKVKKN